MSWWQGLKNRYHLVQAQVWRLVYGYPDTGLKTYGITGTNGKTTTCYVLDAILSQRFGREKVGMLTTVVLRSGSEEEVNRTKMTTLPSALVFKKMQAMRQAGIERLVLEMTSHALDQNRLAGIKLDGAIILNIEREHLDYHRTMEKYAAAKGKIVKYLKAGAPLVAKKDGAWVEKIAGRRAIWFTEQAAEGVSTPLPGAVNKENVLAASLLARAIGVPKSAIESGINEVKRVPGRYERVGLKFQIPNSKFQTNANGQFLENQDLPLVLIDYAVTPTALERLYGDVCVLQQTRGKGKIYAVLGAAGLRDRGKREAMAAAVAKYADEIVLTREDPWTESEEQIYEDLEKGLVGFSNWRRISDRREAIKFCLERAGAEDIVVVTGKGAERGMAVGNKIIPWNDKEVIEALLREMHKTQTAQITNNNQNQKAQSTKLVIDTLGEEASVALVLGDKSFKKKRFTNGPQVATQVLTAIDELLNEVELRLADIKVVEVSQGESKRSSSARAGQVIGELLELLILHSVSRRG